MLKAEYCRYTLDFYEPARTSRQTMLDKLTYFIRVYDDADPTTFGIGECALFKGLSCDDRPDYEEKLADVCRSIDSVSPDVLRDYPSIAFGVETAIMDLRNGGLRCPFPSPWSNGEGGIVINGLVWMGSVEQMRQRIADKIAQGFKCVKFKIGGEDFSQEVKLLESVRQSFGPDRLEIRLDANGAFTPDNALAKLRRLAQLDVHSIEQPIRQGQYEAMSAICADSPIAIALDEELIGINDPEKKLAMLTAVRPTYIILKPALCGGFSGAMEWISIARLQNIDWWATSALESNIGLNAIAQWVSTLHTEMPQGLGTGALYGNNIESPLTLNGQTLTYNPQSHWTLPHFKWKS